MMRDARRYILFGSLVAVLALSGCGAGQHRPSAAASPSRVVASPAARIYAAWQDPALELRGDEVWAETGRRTGGLALALPASPARGSVFVSTECQGAGTLTVDAGPYGTFTEPCSDHADGTLNDAALGAEPATQLKVRGSAGVTWAVAVGWSRTSPSEG